MIKKVLAFTAFFALAACSEDVYQEIDQQNAEPDMMAPATFNPNQPGWYDYGSMTLVEFPGGYYSPWDIWERPNMNVPYEIFNNVPGLTMNVRAYIGLAYYDDVDNGLYQDTFTGNMINLASGNYPNLYANNQEIGNLLLSR